jgi:ABC-2 type transport system ATP-binding protein
LLLDEPANGLDPATIHWLRDFLRAYAGLGRTVLVSSHLLSEMELMADDLIVIARGQLVANEPTDSFIDRSTRNDVYVRSADNAALLDVLTAKGFTAKISDSGLSVLGLDTDTVGHIAFESGLRVFELSERRASLETAFLELTSNAQEFETGGAK